MVRQLSSGWSQSILKVQMLDMEVCSWSGYTWPAFVRTIGCAAKFSETPLEMSHGRGMNIQFTGDGSGGHSCSQHANCMLPQKLVTSVALCCVIKLMEEMCCTVMWIDYRSKGDVLTNTDLDRFERNRPFVYTENILDFLDQLMKNGKKKIKVAFSYYHYYFGLMHLSLIKITNNIKWKIHTTQTAEMDLRYRLFPNNIKNNVLPFL